MGSSLDAHATILADPQVAPIIQCIVLARRNSDFDTAHHLIQPDLCRSQAAIGKRSRMDLSADCHRAHLSQQLDAHECRMAIDPVGVADRDPRYHQIHHSSDPLHYRSNRGSLLTVWDRMFGTYFDRNAAKEKLSSGISERVSPCGLC